MTTNIIQRSIFVSALLLGVLVAGCTSAPPPALQQDVQELGEQCVQTGGCAATGRSGIG